MDLIGNSQPVSVLPNSSDDVFVDFTIPTDSFNIQAKIQGTDPADQNLTNNEAQTTLFYPDIDTDGDGVVDRLDTDDDNDGLLDTQEFDDKCPYRLKADSDGDGVKDGSDAFPCNPSESIDTDHDGSGNNADVDDDNDGWSDAEELAKGTDPLRADTDGDSVIDSQDAYPLDSSKSRVETQSRNIFQPLVNQNVNQSLSPSVQNNKNQAASSTAIETIEGLNKELEKITESAETAKKLKEQPLEKLEEIVSDVTGRTQSFFRLNNVLMWLIIAIILVIGAIIYLLIKGQQSSTRFKLDALKSSKPPFTEQRTITQDKPLTKPKLPPNVINLKEMMKKK
jgi:flagellar hook-basal body complex protein FliE